MVESSLNWKPESVAERAGSRVPKTFELATALTARVAGVIPKVTGVASRTVV